MRGSISAVRLCTRCNVERAYESHCWCPSCLQKIYRGRHNVETLLRECLHCGGSFGTTNKRKMFCSRSCKDKGKLHRLTPAEKYQHHRRQNLKKLYGITMEQYDKLYESQGGRCQGCRQSHEVLVVDHDHVTGDIRGLLCQNCNRGLGLLGDSPQTLRSLADYLSQ